MCSGCRCRWLLSLRPNLHCCWLLSLMCSVLVLLYFFFFLESRTNKFFFEGVPNFFKDKTNNFFNYYI